MIAHFLSKGHSLDELVNLSPTEKLFFQAAWEIELDYIQKMLGEVNNG